MLFYHGPGGQAQMEGGRGGTNGERRSLGGNPLARGARVAPGLSPWPGKAF